MLNNLGLKKVPVYSSGHMKIKHGDLISWSRASVSLNPKIDFQIIK